MIVYPDCVYLCLLEKSKLWNLSTLWTIADCACADVVTTLHSKSTLLFNMVH